MGGGGVALVARLLRPNMDPVKKLPFSLWTRVFDFLDFKTKMRLLRVSRAWAGLSKRCIASEKSSVWVYVVFRRRMVFGHAKLSLNVTTSGPIFWSKKMFYITACNCHLALNHLAPLLRILALLGSRVERLCLVDSPCSLPFVPDRLVHAAATRLPRLQFLYLRELDLEYVNFATVQALAGLPSLKRLVLHNCRSTDVFSDFALMPRRLMVVSGAVGVNSLGLGLPESLEEEAADLASAFQTENKRAIFLTSRKGVSASKSADFDAL